MNVMTEQEALINAVVDDIVNGIEDECILILADWCEDNEQYDLAEFFRTLEPFSIVETTEGIDWFDVDEEPVTSRNTTYEDNSASWYDVYRRCRHGHFQSISDGRVSIYLSENQNFRTGNYETSYVLIEAKDQRPLPGLVVDILEQLFN